MKIEKTSQAIGILDSGVGGLTVVKEVMRQLPQEKIFYFGDRKRCPYGPRPPKEVLQFTQEIVDFLTKFSLKALIIACNTATAVALEQIQKEVEIPVLGVIAPGARAALRESLQKRIGVIGTEGTIQSRAYEKELKRLEPSAFVISHACPSLVPLVESGIKSRKMALEEVRRSLSPLKRYKLDTLILGCTHYPLLADLIQQVMGDDVNLINSAEETARELGEILQTNFSSIGNKQLDPPCHHFFTSGEAEDFQLLAEKWLGQKVSVKQINLDDPSKNTYIQ